MIDHGVNSFNEVLATTGNWDNGGEGDSRFDQCGA